MKNISLFFIVLFIYGIAFSQDQKQSIIPGSPILNMDNQIDQYEFPQINSQRAESDLMDLGGGCNIGNESDPGWDSGSFSLNFLLGVKFTLLEEGVLNSINLIGNNTGAGVQMAVYDDNAGVPNDLVVHSGITTVGSGVVTLPVSATQLSPGDYWIMAVYDANGGHSDVGQDITNNSVYYIDLLFGDPIPINASGFLTYDGQDFLYFLDITCTSPVPVNDECENAIAVECGDIIVGETLTATDTGENSAPDVWYSYTGGEGTVTLSLCDGGTDYDSYLRVFDACDGNVIAVNDDYCAAQSELSFDSDGTTTYIIMVEGFGSNSGNYSLEVSCLLGTNDNTIEGFSYFPNPTTNIINLSAKENIESVAIYNVLGQKVVDQNINATNSQLNVADLTTGTYLMEVSVEGKTTTFKIMKK